MTTQSPRHLLKDLGAIVLITTLTACGLAPARTPSPADVSSPGWLFRDDFSSAPGEWKASPWLQPGQWHGEELSGGEYRMWVDNSQKPYDFSTSTPGRSFGDLRLEVDVRRVSGSEGAGAFLICRLDPRSGSFYYFKLDGKGVAEIGVYLNGEEQHVVGQHLPAGMVKADVNHLRADCIGSKLSFYINGQFALDTDEKGYPSGEVGLGAGGADGGTSDFRFDNFVVYPPNAVVALAATPTGNPPPATTGPTQPTIEPTEIPRPTPGPPPPPSDTLDVIQAKVDSGAWTYEEGIVQSLKILDGEASADDVLGTLPRSMEGTGLVIEAQRVLDTTTDPQVKAEIQRLLSIIVPSSDRLQEYSQPAPVSLSARPDGLAAPVRAAEDCDKLYQEGFPPGSGIKCLLLRQGTVGGQPVEVYFPIVAMPLGYADAAYTAIVDSWNTYSQLKPGGQAPQMKGVQLVFVLLPAIESPTVLAMVPFKYNKAGDDQCKIVVYLGAIQYNEKHKQGVGDFGRFQQTVAHEMFHCFQSWNYTANFHSGWYVQKWWGEGTAEYFSNVVYPKTNAEWDWLADFGYLSNDHSLVDMSYPNTVFFQYLADKDGDPAVLQLIGEMPVGGKRSDQEAALAKHADMQAVFQDFGRTYFDGKIWDTSGVTLPDTGIAIVPSEHDITFTEAQVRLAETKPFVLTHYYLTFPRSYRYSVSSVLKGPGEMLDTARLFESPGAWADLPKQVTATCDPVTFLWVLTSTDGTGAPSTLELNVTPTEKSLCDKCLIGTWQLDKDSFKSYMEAPFLKSGTPFSMNGSEGNWQWVFTKAGEIKANYKFVFSYSINQTILNQPFNTDVTVSVEGPAVGGYDLPEPGKMNIEPVSLDFHVDQSASINGQPAGSGPIDFTPFPKVKTGAIYTCQQDTLTISLEPLLGTLPPVQYFRETTP